MKRPDWIGYWDEEEQAWMIGHSSVALYWPLRWPVSVDIQQMKIALGITCPRHRSIWKRKLGRFGRMIPDLEWNEAGDKLVNVRRQRD